MPDPLRIPQMPEGKTLGTCWRGTNRFVKSDIFWMGLP
jgi:hypothetical protein